MDRRSFIKLTAVSGTTAALASCGNPDHQLVRFVPDEDIVPGQAVWKPGVCPLCPSGCGLTVRVMDADADVTRDGKSGVVQILAAKKLEGSPNHPINRGGLCPRGQAAIQVTYHPDRITQPLKRTGNRGDGTYEAVSWDAALAELVGSLNTLAGGGSAGSLAFLGRPGNGHRQALIADFLSRFGAPAPVTYELFADDVLRRANGISFGSAQLPTFDLANTRYLLSFGADFLGTWNAPVSHARAYGDMRQGQPGVRGHFVQIESRMSQTGASADEWVAIRPGTEGALALGIAHVILRDTRQNAGVAGAAALPGWSQGLPDYSPEQVEKATGVAATKIERLAREFAQRGPAAAAVGGAALAHTNALFTAVAVNALNALAGTVGKPGGMSFTPQLDVAAAAKSGRVASAASSLQQWSSAVLADAAPGMQVLLIDGVNPVFTAPRAWKVRDALARIPFIVSFGSFLDETSLLADLILPDHSFLESWSESVPESGSSMAVVSTAPPVMKPLHQTRATPDVLLDVARQLDKPLEMPWQTFDEMLAMTVTPLPAMTEGVDAWTDAQEKGGWWGELPSALRLKPDSMPAIRLKPDSTPPIRLKPDSTVESGFSRIQPDFDGDLAQYPFHFLPYPSNQFLDGSLAHLPWLQEMPDPMTSAMWSSWIEINPQTAARLGIVQGDLVEVTSQHGTVRSPAYLSPGIAPDVVAMPAGQGHTNYTRYASGRGENPVDLLAPMTEETTGAVAWAATRVKISRAADGDGRLILFAGGMREHVDHGR